MDEVTMNSLAEEFPDWHVWEGVNHLWYARLPGAEPPITVHGEDLADLRDQVIHKVAQFRERAWAEGRRSSRDD